MLVVAVLKLSFTLELVLQAAARQWQSGATS